MGESVKEKVALEMVEEFRRLYGDAPAAMRDTLFNVFAQGYVLGARDRLGRFECYPGLRLVCLDDHQGANFLVKGNVYTVDQIQINGNGSVGLCLVGMAHMWEMERFRVAETAEVIDALRKPQPIGFNRDLG